MTPMRPHQDPPDYGPLPDRTRTIGKPRPDPGFWPGMGWAAVITIGVALVLIFLFV